MPNSMFFFVQNTGGFLVYIYSSKNYKLYNMRPVLLCNMPSTDKDWPLCPEYEFMFSVDAVLCTNWVCNNSGVASCKPLTHGDGQSTEKSISTPRARFASSACQPSGDFIHHNQTLACTVSSHAAFLIMI